MTRAELEALSKGLAPVVQQAIAAALAPILARLAELETRGLPAANGEPLTPAVRFDGERALTVSWRAGDRVLQEDVITLPIMLYRGVWLEGKVYEPGDTCTWSGGLWIATQQTNSRPGHVDPASRAWKLASKAGRDGKPGRDGRDAA